MGIIESIESRAKLKKRKIALLEGEDQRMVEAFLSLKREGYADPILVGKKEMGDLIKNYKDEISENEYIYPIEQPNLREYAEIYCEKRKSKGMKIDVATKIFEDPLFYGAMMLSKGVIDGFVAGAVNSTANVFRAGLHIIGLEEGIKTASSCFLMVVPDCEYGTSGGFIYADCGLLPNPDANQLADIALASAHSAKALLNSEPYVAMLAFSTKGSASDPTLTKVIEATKIIKEKHPEIIIDGELQADAALIEKVGKAKAPDSPVVGKANVLVFPDLNSGNIAYKLTERLAKATAIGPLPQGFLLPFSDLSRGCKASDIVTAACIVAAQVK